MNPELVEFFNEVGRITGDESVGRGIVTSIGAVAVVLATGWKLFSRRKTDRVVVSVNAPAGEKVYVQLGDDNEE